jgi:hypothetical protein
VRGEVFGWIFGQDTTVILFFGTRKVKLDIHWRYHDIHDSIYWRYDGYLMEEGKV